MILVGPSILQHAQGITIDLNFVTHSSRRPVILLHVWVVSGVLTRLVLPMLAKPTDNSRILRVPVGHAFVCVVSGGWFGRGSLAGICVQCATGISKAMRLPMVQLRLEVASLMLGLCRRHPQAEPLRLGLQAARRR